MIKWEIWKLFELCRHQIPIDFLSECVYGWWRNGGPQFKQETLGSITDWGGHVTASPGVPDSKAGDLFTLLSSCKEVCLFKSLVSQFCEGTSETYSWTWRVGLSPKCWDGIGRSRNCDTKDDMRRQKFPALVVSVLACDGKDGGGRKGIWRHLW